MLFLATAFVSLAGLARAVDMSLYQAGAGVDEGFKAFVEEYYLINEDKYATTNFTDLFTEDAIMILQGREFDGPATMLQVRNSLLPINANPTKDWWHLIETAEVAGEEATSKTFAVTMTVQTTYTPGNCSQAHGNVAFTVRKDTAGVVQLDPHGQNLMIYNLTMNTIATPTDESCTVL